MVTATDAQELQRKLRLPQAGSDDVLMQYRMMQRLQDLAGAASASGSSEGTQLSSDQPVSPTAPSISPPPDATTDSPPPFDPSQLMKNLEPEDIELIKQLGERYLRSQQSSSGPSLPGSPTLPGASQPTLPGQTTTPNVQSLRDFLSDPAVSGDPRVQDLLQRFARDRQLPQSIPGSGPGLLPSGLLPSDSKPLRPTQTDGQRDPTSPTLPTLPLGDSPPAPSNRPNPGDPRQSPRQSENRATTTEPGAIPTALPTTTPTRSDSRTGSPQPTSPLGPKPAPAQVPANPTPANRSSQDSLSQASTNRMLEQFGLRPAQGPRSGGHPPTQSNTPETTPGEGPSQSPSSQGQQPFSDLMRGIRDRLGTQASSRDQESFPQQLPSVQEFLGSIAKDPSQLPSVSELIGELPRSQSGLSNLPKGNSELSRNLRQLVTPDMIRTLDRNGLKETIRNVIKQSEQEIAFGPPRTTAPPSVKPSDRIGTGFERSVLQAIEGVSKDLLSSEKENNEPKQQTSKPNRKRARLAPSSTANDQSRGAAMPEIDEPGSSSKKRTKKSEGFIAAASNAVNRWATGGDPQEPQSPASENPNASAPANNSSASPFPLAMIILGLAVAGIAFWFRRQQDKQTVSTEQVGRLDLESEIDVIRTFHLLARAGSPERAEDWWTHGRTAIKLSEAAPLQRSAWFALADLYERVRYAPGPTKLDEAQLREARTAVGRIQQERTSTHA